MINILQICDNFENSFGGIARYCHGIALMFSNDNEISMHVLNKLDNIKIKYIKIINKKYISLTSLIKYIRDNKIMVIHINGFASLVVVESLIVSIITGIKIVYSPHFHPFKELNHPFLGKLGYYLLINPLLSYVDIILTINNEDTKFFMRSFKNVIKIPHWHKDYTKSIANNIDQEKNTALFIGRWENNKGIEYLYELASLGIKIYCVTNKKLKINNMVFYNKISDFELNQLYKKAEFIIIPSKYEAFSFVALEAFLNYKKIVMSNKVRIADYISDSPNVFIFKYGDMKDFKKIIDKVIHTENIFYDEEKYSEIMEIFSFQKAKIKLKEIYLNL